MYMYMPCLFVCLTLLASYFLPSHLSLKHVYSLSTTCTLVHVHVIALGVLCCFALLFV